MSRSIRAPGKIRRGRTLGAGVSAPGNIGRVSEEAPHVQRTRKSRGLSRVGCHVGRLAGALSGCLAVQTAMAQFGESFEPPEVPVPIPRAWLFEARLMPAAVLGLFGSAAAFVLNRQGKGKPALGCLLGGLGLAGGLFVSAALVTTERERVMLAAEGIDVIVVDSAQVLPCATCHAAGCCAVCCPRCVLPRSARLCAALCAACCVLRVCVRETLCSRSR